MSNTYTTEGIILNRRDYQEHDRLFCVFTKDYGKIDFVAKGTKKISSKLNSYMEPFYLVKLMIAKGKVIDKLANCNIIKTYQSLRSDESLNGFYLINYLSEVTNGLIHGQISDQKKYNLLLEVLDILDKSVFSKNKQELIMLVNIYYLKLLSYLGYQPEVQRCLSCHQGLLLTKNIFNFSLGGLICEKCKKLCLLGDFIEVSDTVIKLLQLAKEKDLAYFVNLESDQKELQQFNIVIYKLLLVNLERPIYSWPSLAMKV